MLDINVKTLFSSQVSIQKYQFECESQQNIFSRLQREIVYQMNCHYLPAVSQGAPL